MNNVPLNNDDKEIQINAMIQQMAQQHQPELPSPGVIWWRAQIQKKLAEKECIERPLVIMRMLATVACLALVAAVVGASWVNWKQILFAQNTILRGLILSASATVLIFLASLFLTVHSKSRS
jgi:hypothetical protein